MDLSDARVEMNHDFFGVVGVEGGTEEVPDAVEVRARLLEPPVPLADLRQPLLHPDVTHHLVPAILWYMTHFCSLW